jgi:hypothetical protein
MKGQKRQERTQNMITWSDTNPKHNDMNFGAFKKKFQGVILKLHFIPKKQKSNDSALFIATDAYSCLASFASVERRVFRQAYGAAITDQLVIGTIVSSQTVSPTTIRLATTTAATVLIIIIVVVVVVVVVITGWLLV